MPTMWMVRGESGRLYDEFRERGVVAIGWNVIADQVQPGQSREQVADLYRAAEPGKTQGQIVAGASQVWRFVNEIEVGDWVVTYSPGNRTYLIGEVAGAFQYRPDWIQDDLGMIRPVSWREREVDRDAFSQSSKNLPLIHI